VARVQCLTRGTHFDVDLPAFRSAWHLAVESNMAYRLTLLCRTPDGGLKTLAVSQTVCPPVRHAWQAGRAPTELIQARRQPLTRRLPWTEEPAAWLTTASAAPGGAARPSASVGPPLTGVGPDSAALRPSWSRVNFGEGR
jgi:hypothetical protein